MSQPAHCSKTVLQHLVSIARRFARGTAIERAVYARRNELLTERILAEIKFMNLGNRNDEAGKVGYIILWLLGVPFSVLLLIFLLRSC